MFKNLGMEGDQNVKKKRFLWVRDKVFMSILAERVRDFEKQVNYIFEIVEVLKEGEHSTELNPDGFVHRDLTATEKNLFNFGMKGLLAKKRLAWRTVVEEERTLREELTKFRCFLQEQHEEGAGDSFEDDKKAAKQEAEFTLKIRMSKFQRRKIEDEVTAWCDRAVEAIFALYHNGQQERILPSESRIFYLKMEADLNRYKLEILHFEYDQCRLRREMFEDADEFKQLREDTKDIYLRGCEEVENLEASNKLRLGLMLNYSVFLYEICEQVDDARFIAKKSFDEALKLLPHMQDEADVDEILPVLQALRDNYEVWAVDVVSDSKKAELAEMKERERVQKLQLQHKGIQRAKAINSLN